MEPDLSLPSKVRQKMQKLLFHSFDKCLLQFNSVPSNMLTADAAAVTTSSSSYAVQCVF